MPGEKLPFENHIDGQEKIEAGKEQSDQLRDAKVAVNDFANQPTTGIDDDPLKNTQELMAGKVEVSENENQETDKNRQEKLFRAFNEHFQGSTDPGDRPSNISQVLSFSYVSDSKGHPLFQIMYKAKKHGDTPIIANMRLAHPKGNGDMSLVFDKPFDAETNILAEDDRLAVAKIYEKNGYTYEEDKRIAGR